MNEAEFLDLFAMTNSTVSIQEFYLKTNSINKRIEKENFSAFKRGVEKGKEIANKLYKYFGYLPKN